MAGATVTTKQGKIVGISGVDLDGGKFYKFLGIPYAKPPVGPLRFKAPQPAEPWQGTLDCTKDGSPSRSFKVSALQPVGCEDCLYLNVHTRHLPSANTQPKPVMVYIHGGAFTFGSGTQEMCDPAYLMTQDVVLVTMNYRLGVFGFLSLDDDSLDVPGNAGLKDQTMALKWVQQNISCFNGDPNNVTIFGVSAGGAAVQFQVLSPTAKGLFHKAIAQSGSVLNPWAWGQKNAIQLASKLGHNVTTEKEALEVLMKASTDEIVGAAQTFNDILIDPKYRRPFGPVIEKPNPTAFLSEDPQTLLASGKYNHVPLIQGICSREGLIYHFFSNLLSPIFAPDHHMVPWKVNLDGEQAKAWTEELRKFYYKDGFNLDGVYEFIGDAFFGVGVVHSTKLALKNAVHPIYFYVLAYDADMIKAYKKLLQIDEDVRGVSHAMDHSLLFPSHIMPGIDIKLTEDDVKAIKTFVQIWTDFAKKGVPHPEWRPVSDVDNLEYLLVDKELQVLNNPLEQSMNLWSKLLEESGGLDLRLKERP